MEKVKTSEKERKENFEEFISENYLKELNNVISKGEESLSIDYKILELYDPELADILCEEPESTLNSFEEVLNKIEISEGENIKIRIKNLPESKRINIKDIRSKHIGKLIAIEGLIRQTSAVRPVCATAIYECPSCGSKIEVEQGKGRLKKPSVCSCGRKRNFSLIEKKLVDTQRVIIEEPPEKLVGGSQPDRFKVFLKKDLVEPKMEKKTIPGNRVIVTGILREIPVKNKGGGKSTKFDLMMNASHIESVEKEFEEIEIDSEDEMLIKELASEDNIYEKLVNSIAPSIQGHEKIKEAIVLQLFGGKRTERPDGTKVRGDIHILLVGDPGTGKSQMLKYVSEVAPKGRYVSGKGASGVGLTASVIKDEFMEGFSLEAGTLVLANKGIAVIDEIDKMSNEDRVAMHESMEQQTVTISKANIHATLQTETTILAAANPKLGRFDPYSPIAEQIDMPATLISRFDLIFPIRDVPDRDKDEKLARKVLKSIKNPEQGEPEVSFELMRKYIAYAKQHSRPELTEEAIRKMKNFFVDLRNSSTKEEEEVKPIPISARQLEALVRLSHASARIRLSKKVTEKDAERALKLMKYCLTKVGMDTETGEYDIDRIVTGISTSKRSRIITIRQIIKDLEDQYGKNIPLSDIVDEAEERDLDKDKVEEVLDKMKRDGELFEPENGVVRRMPK